MKSTYSIKDLERLSGIKAHTIRIWEQRYDIVKPKRTDTNIRFYEDDDLRKLLNVSFLVHDGVKISKVANLNDDQMHSLVQERARYVGNHTAEINELKMAMFAYDEEAFSKAFAQSVKKYGEEETFTHVLGGFISQIGILWQTNTVNLSHEHFSSNLIKQKLFAGIDKLPTTKAPNAKTFLLYLPADELHEIGLLYLVYLVRKNGQRVIAMGQNTPADYLVEVYDKVSFDYAISVFTMHPHCSVLQDYLQKIEELFSNTPVVFHFAGIQLMQLIEDQYSNPKIKLYKTVKELASQLTV